MRRLALFVAVLLIAACTKRPPRKPPPPTADPKQELKAKLSELYASLEELEADRLNDVLTADVMAYGLGPKDTFTDRDRVVEAVRADLVPFGLRGDVFKRAASDPKVALAPGEQSGWFYDFPRFEQVRGAKPSRFWKARVTGHAIRDEGSWRIDALHVSFGYPDAELYAPEAAKRLRAPKTAGAEKGPGSDELIGLSRHLLEDIAVKVDRISDSPEAVLIGTDPGDVYQGGAKFKELARPKLPELKKAVFSLKFEDGPRARLAPDEKSGWVTGVVVLRLGKPPTQQVLPPFRALWMFAKEKELWTLVSEHQSLGLPNELRKPSGGGDDAADALR